MSEILSELKKAFKPSLPVRIVREKLPFDILGAIAINDEEIVYGSADFCDYPISIEIQTINFIVRYKGEEECAYHAFDRDELSIIDQVNFLQLSEEEDEMQLLVPSLILRLIKVFEQKRNDYKINPKVQVRLIQAIRYIRENLANDITREELAEDLGVTPYYVYKLIKNNMNLGVQDLINVYRISYARNFLLAKNFESLNEVAEKSGFKTADYFGQVFKKYTGQTPGQFIKAPSFEQFLGFERQLLAEKEDFRKVPGARYFSIKLENRSTLECPVETVNQNGRNQIMAAIPPGRGAFLVGNEGTVFLIGKKFLNMPDHNCLVIIE